MDNESLSVNETFVSIQGESSYAGRLCFFIRLAGCNLNCTYCDTLYAHSIDQGESLSITSLVDMVIAEQVPLVEITGGEPLLQDGVAELSSLLIERGVEVMIETNGSLPVNILPKKVKKIVDCKTPSSGVAKLMNYDNFSWLDGKDEVKFLISDWKDYEFSIGIIETYNLTKITKNILFSPVWGKITPKDLAERIIKDRKDVRMQLQMHKLIWGPDEEGV